MENEHQNTGSNIHTRARASELDWKEQLKGIIRKGDEAAVERFLDDHPDLNLEDSFEFRFSLGSEAGITFLMLAGSLDHAGIVRVLLRKGSNILAESDDNRETVLHLATRECVSMETLQILVQEGGVELIKRQNEYGESALHTAVESRRPEVVRSLVEKAATCSDDGASEVLNQPNEFGWTALHYAADRGESRVVEDLLHHKADACAKTADGCTALHLAVRYGRATVDSEHHAVTQMLVKRDGYDESFDEVCSFINEKDDRGWTALHWAASSIHPACLNTILEGGADFYAAADNGATVLHISASDGYPKTVEAVLKRLDADVNLARRAFFQKGAHQKALDKRRDSLSARTTDNDTALAMAASRGHLDTVLEILESTVLFPKLPAQHKPYFSDSAESEHVSNLLLHCLDLHEQGKPYVKTIPIPNGQKTRTLILDDPKIIRNHMAAIIYWAILNRQKATLDRYLAGSDSLPHLNRQGMSWAAVAALGANTSITETILSMEYSEGELCDQAAINLLRLAIKNENFAFIQSLLRWLGAGPTPSQHDDGERSTHDAKSREIPMIPPSKAVSILLNSDGDEPSAISLSARGGISNHRDIESFLWKVLNQSVGKEQHFMSLAEEDQDRILELATRYETPGDAGYLVHYLQYLCPDPLTSNVLRRVVSLKKPVVLWWLLSKSEHPSEDDIKYAEEQAKSWGEDDRKGRIVLELLENPPSIRQSRAPADDHHRLSFEHPASDFGSPWGTVLDLFCENGQNHQDVLYQLKHSPVIDIIYRRGPRTIMRGCKYREVSALREALKNDPPAEPPKATSELDHRKRSKMALEQGCKKAQEAPSEEDVRWVHIPVTNLQCMKELLIRLSNDKSLTNKAHRPLASFIDSNQAVMDAGGHKTYMKPQYVEQGVFNQSPAEETMRNSSALYMPFLGWSEWPREPDHNGPQDNPVNQEQSYMTLDQYYYSSISDTTERDSDQVVGRFTRPKNRREPVGTPSSSAPQHILIVNQLWLFTLDEKTIITFTTRESTNTTKSFFQRVLANLKSQKSGTPWSVEIAREIIISTAIGMFDVPEIGSDPSPKKSPLAIFRESIQNVREKEAALYKSFCEQLEDDLKREKSSEGRDDTKAVKIQRLCKSLWLFMADAVALRLRREQNIHTLDADRTGDMLFEEHDTQAVMATGARSDARRQTARGRRPDRKKSQKENISASKKQYDNILAETALLREIKDINDELNILQSLAEDQKEVCNRLWGEKSGRKAGFTYNTPSKIQAEIKKMIKDAETVRKSLDMLLDLKQKQANINEAKSSRKQSEETAKQSVAIMVFTLVTTAFLPASFLTSLFALNVSDFPHVGGSVSYKGEWIFPIIFGVSVGVSSVIALIAFQLSKWSKRWKAVRDKLDRDVEVGEQAS